ncbi:zinc ribbon domain-containing protein [Streptacidiphilus melanogenes]|uniref:zinc ribbon domain-containing protein n=1 Tax=Streptacidiphilus melanogenes TaxID=411235 RepID=UPI0005AB8544|nr:zinc ribbon domain-containing protein [Streptacidiphilus melanogenes]
MNGQNTPGEIYFSNNYHDLCQQYGTGAGFQFEFGCSRCHDTWRSAFQPYASGRVSGWLDKAVGSAWGALGRAGSEASAALDGLVGANWGPAKDAAFRRAIADAQGHFNRCARCTSYVCERCFNPAQGLCHGCAPDTAAEVAAAQQRGLNDVATSRAYDLGGSQGAQYNLDRPFQLVCPQCHTETHGANFCPGCGHKLGGQDACGSCQSELPQGAAFCPHCGTRR